MEPSRKKRVIEISSDEDEEAGLPAPKVARAGSNLNKAVERPADPRKQPTKRPASDPVSSSELLREAEACKRDVISTFPEYKAALRCVSIEVSERMQSSGAKTVFDGETLRPRCVRLSLPIFSVRDNMHSALNDVMRHELAHVIAGRNAAHGPEWQRICRRIGGTAALYHSLSCQGSAPQPDPEPRRTQKAPASRHERRGTSSAGTGSTDKWRKASDSLISQIIRF